MILKTIYQTLNNSVSYVTDKQVCIESDAISSFAKCLVSTVFYPIHCMYNLSH